MDFRHEWKHEISLGDKISLSARLRAVMRKDPHVVGDHYDIRSIYFDNIYDKALLEKINGVNCREKFRIRYYNGDLSYILLEKKSKIKGLCNKQQCVISLDEAKMIADGNIENLKNTDKPLLQELYLKMHSQGLKPKTIVDYTREPFIYGPGNVRVTIDYHIRTGLFNTDFLNPDSITIPVMDDPIILEVKWDAYLPSIIRDIVQIPSTRTTAFSKYEACRTYD